MNADKDYTFIKVCPKTEEIITNTGYRGGICPHCGDDNNGSFTHSKKIVGRFIRPTFWEWLAQGKKTEFLRKEDEDKTWDGLQQ